MPLAKLRTPYEYSIAQYRALGMRYKNSEPWVLSEPLRALNQMEWESRSPEGYSDETPTWLNPDAMRVRLNIAQYVSYAFAPEFDAQRTSLGEQPLRRGSVGSNARAALPPPATATMR